MNTIANCRDGRKEWCFHFIVSKRRGAIYHVCGNVRQRQFQILLQQLKDPIERFDKDLGKYAGFLLIIDNTRWNHKALRMMTDERGYYQSANDDQVALLNGSVTAKELKSDGNNGSRSRAQFYCIRKPTDQNLDNAGIVLMNWAGVAPFQPAEFLFSQMKKRLPRLPETVSGHTT